MKKMLMTAVLSMAALTWAGQADATPVYLGSYEGSNLTPTTYAGWYKNADDMWANPSYALGAPDDKHISITYGDWLVYAFSENILIDNDLATADIVLRENGKDTLVTGSINAMVDISVSKTGLAGDWHDVGTVEVENDLYVNNYSYGGVSYLYALKGVDLSTTSLDWVRYIRFDGVASTGNMKGFDLDAVAGEPVPEPASLLLFGSGALSLFGLRRRKKK
ncbi:MAG: PEP-CTERM sorting domain-containing protein [Thermodesulfobacteriota bacterium]